METDPTNPYVDDGTWPGDGGEDGWYEFDDEDAGRAMEPSWWQLVGGVWRRITSPPTA